MGVVIHRQQADPLVVLIGCSYDCVSVKFGDFALNESDSSDLCVSRSIRVDWLHKFIKPLEYLIALAA